MKRKTVVEIVVCLAILGSLVVSFNALIERDSQAHQKEVRAMIGKSETELRKSMPVLELDESAYQEFRDRRSTSVSLPPWDRSKVFYASRGFDVYFFFVRKEKVERILFGKT